MELPSTKSTDCEAVLNGPMQCSPINVFLVEENLWMQFHRHTTEMIVTKQGRKLFPKLVIVFEGLEPTHHYAVEMRLIRADNKKYRYCSGSWTSTPDDDVEREAAEREAPPFAWSNEGYIRKGLEWMEKPVEFSNFKLTNNADDSSREMLKVQSLHKYIPTIMIYHIPSIETERSQSYRDFPCVFQRKLKTAEFIVVTAYQNDAVRELKTKHNPFAKGIRSQPAPASGTNGLQNGRKRPASPSSPEEKTLHSVRNGHLGALQPQPQLNDPMRASDYYHHQTAPSSFYSQPLPTYYPSYPHLPSQFPHHSSSYMDFPHGIPLSYPDFSPLAPFPHFHASFGRPASDPSQTGDPRHFTNL